MKYNSEKKCATKDLPNENNVSFIFIIFKKLVRPNDSLCKQSLIIILYIIQQCNKIKIINIRCSQPLLR